MNLIYVHLCLLRILHEVELKSSSSWMEISGPYREEEEEGGSFKVTADFCNLLMIPLESFWKHPGDKWIKITASIVFSGKALFCNILCSRQSGRCNLQALLLSATRDHVIWTTLAETECPHPSVLSSYVSNYFIASPFKVGS